MLIRACVIRVVDAGAESIVVAVNVDDIFAMRLKSRCDKPCEDLDQFVPINNLGSCGGTQLPMFSGRGCRDVNNTTAHTS